MPDIGRDITIELNRAGAVYPRLPSCNQDIPRILPGHLSGLQVDNPHPGIQDNGHQALCASGIFLVRTPSCRQSIGTWPPANLPRLATFSAITARLVKQASMHTSRLFIMPLTMFCKISSSRFILETHASSNYHIPLACFAGIPMVNIRAGIKTKPATGVFFPSDLQSALFTLRHRFTRSCF